MSCVGRFLRAAAWLPVLAVGMLFGHPTAIQAASPGFGGVSPRGAQRGTEIEATLSGSQLHDAKEVLFYEPGIEVLSLKVVNPGQIKAKFKIAPDASLGSHRLRVRTATGISELRPFFVGALLDVAEKEPNSDFASPQSVPVNCTVSGVVNSEDVDYFVVTAKKGDRITAEVEAIRLGISMFDVYVAIMDSARFELSASDDSPLLWQDGVASIIAPADGKYIVQVRDSAYTGSGEYRVHIGNFPRPLATLPAGGKVGESTAVRFLGDVSGEWTETVPLPALLRSDFGLFAHDARGIAPSQNRFRLSEFGNTLEAEPNDTHANATRFSPPIALNGVISQPGDVDLYRFTGKKGETYDIRVHGRSVRSPLDPVLTIYAAGGGGIAGNDDSEGPDSYLRFTVPNNGDYVIEVRDHLKNGGPHYAYRVEFAPVKPRLTLSVNEFVQYTQPSVSIPRGGHFGIVLSASRFDFGGPLEIRGENLPPGVTVECPGMPGNAGNVPVLFHAAPGAAVSGRLADIIGALNDPKQPTLKVTGNVQQPMVLIRGQNNIPFWTEHTSKLPVAVTEEAPFAITLVEPKVPLVRGGSMELKVVAQRKSNFKAPIKIDMLWLPPGINASSSVSIPEGKTDATITINAAGNAEINTWKIAVRGEANSGQGSLMLCTPFAVLRVAEMYVNLTFEAAAVERGQETEVVVNVQKQYDFPGSAQVDLFGLPNKVSTTTQQITKDSKSIIFKLKTDVASPVGNHNNLFCRVIVTENGEPVVHGIGTGRLRIDAPLPPKKNAPPPSPKVATAKAPPPKPVVQQPPVVKRLTRLEQLRLEQAEREKAKKAGTSAP